MPRILCRWQRFQCMPTSHVTARLHVCCNNAWFAQHSKFSCVLFNTNASCTSQKTLNKVLRTLHLKPHVLYGGDCGGVGCSPVQLGGRPGM